jgi:hypothetical protein
MRAVVFEAHTARAVRVRGRGRRWTPWRTFVGQAQRAELVPWCSEQIYALEHLGSTPLTWRLGDARDLPAAAWQELGAAASQA